MKTRYIVAVPTPMGGAFAGPTGGLCSEYPDAKVFGSLAKARHVANFFEGAQVYTTEGYAAGTGPVWTVQ